MSFTPLLHAKGFFIGLAPALRRPIAAKQNTKPHHLQEGIRHAWRHALP